MIKKNNKISILVYAYHGGEVAGGEQVSSVEGEEDNSHAGQDEVVEGDVHCCLATPVG